MKKDSIPPLKPIACDCQKAIKVTIGWNSKYGPTVDTKGYGDIQEIPIHDKHSKYYFETEHNSAWYLLKMNADGELVFDIKPEDPTNDYDFLLFKYTDTSFCRDFRARKLIPIRSNISRVSDEDSGKTGLSSSAKVEYETRGKGFAYSKSIQVKKGEQYMLVLDNVYDSGKGHAIFFHVLKDYHFSGKTLGDDSLPVAADISITANNGTVVAKTVSNKTTGEYNLLAPLEIGGHYSIVSYTENSFFDIKTFIAGTKQKDTIKYKPVVLPTLKDSSTYKLKNILFIGDSPEPLPSSYATLDALYAILTIHNKMKIRIEGHVNAPGAPNMPFYQNLSEDRANTVYTYLIDKGIEKDRLSKIGFGNRFPLFTGYELLGDVDKTKPLPSGNFITDDQMAQNRRVEIRVLSLGE